MKKIPPVFAQRLLHVFLRDDLAEEVSGDLEEKFYKTIEDKSVFRAKVNYWHQVIHYVRPFALKRLKPQHLNRYDMLKSYFKIGWRNLIRSKGYSLINIGGLTIGMTIAILIGMWIYDELSFNTYHKNYPNVVQIMKGASFEGKSYVGQRHLPFPLIEELKSTYGTNFKHIVPFRGEDAFLGVGDKRISQTGGNAGESIAEMLTLKMISGSWDGLKDPHSVFLSASTAKALFDKADPVNQIIQVNNKLDVKVTGVYEDLPYNSEFNKLKFILPWELHITNNKWITEQGWENHFLFIYAELAPHLSMAQVNETIRESEMKAIRTIPALADELKYNPIVLLHPMANWHLYSNFRDEGLDNGPIESVRIIAIIGGFVLLLACINFMNLSTARSEKRAKEVGIRKSIGSIRSQLVYQFFSESFLVVLIAFVISLLCIALVLPAFNDLTGKGMIMPWANISFWISSFAFVLIVGLLAGSYPALYLSSFNAVSVLKGTFRMGRLASLPRKVLVVVQFSVSVALIIGTIVIYNQVMFARNRPVGYAREGLVMVQRKSEEFFTQASALRNELKKTGIVEEVAESGGIVTDVWSGNGGFDWQGRDPSMDDAFATLNVSHTFGKTVGWQFVDGRDFSEEFTSDSSGFVLNEAAIRYMKLKDPVGQIVHWKNTVNGVDKDFRILGVIKDMVMESPFDPAKPTIFFLSGWKGWFAIKINPGVSVSKALPEIANVFKKVIPSAPFDYKFIDQEYELKFIAEERIGKLAAVFSVLAIFVSCLGLFGLASFVAEQRTKEIGIRKVVGASVFTLWKMLSKDFVILTTISCLIATPIAYYFLSDWLQNYSYRMTMSFWTFLLVSAGAVLITLITVSYQAIRSARMNPVKSLRSE